MGHFSLFVKWRICLAVRLWTQSTGHAPAPRLWHIHSHTWSFASSAPLILPTEVHQSHSEISPFSTQYPENWHEPRTQKGQWDSWFSRENLYSDLRGLFAVEKHSGSACTVSVSWVFCQVFMCEQNVVSMMATVDDPVLTLNSCQDWTKWKLRSEMGLVKANGGQK